MKTKPYPFWTWNKHRKMSLMPPRKPSGKAPLKVRSLQSLRGIPMYRRAEKRMRQLRREAELAAIMQHKFGGKVPAI